MVKEVERLKKNREERRAKQAEMITVKEAQKNLDPGSTANWEFLSMIQEYQETIEFHPLTDSDPVTNHQISVCVRKRPLNNKEKKKREIDVVCCPNKDQVIVHEPKTKVRDQNSAALGRERRKKSGCTKRREPKTDHLKELLLKNYCQVS